MLTSNQFRSIMWNAFQSNGLPGTNYTHPDTKETFNPSQRMAYSFADALLPELTTIATSANTPLPKQPAAATHGYSHKTFNKAAQSVSASAACGWSDGAADKLFKAIYEGTFTAVDNVTIQLDPASVVSLATLVNTFQNIHYSVDFSTKASISTALLGPLRAALSTNLIQCEHTPTREALCVEAAKRLASMISDLKYTVSGKAKASPVSGNPGPPPPVLTVMLS